MSHTVVEKQDDFAVEGKADVDHSEVLKNSDLMNDAFDGENREHELGVWEATKKHPWACFWAFIMCFTIVSTSNCWSFALRLVHGPKMQQELTGNRSWSHLTCS